MMRMDSDYSSNGLWAGIRPGPRAWAWTKGLGSWAILLDRSLGLK